MVATRGGTDGGGGGGSGAGNGGGGGGGGGGSVGSPGSAGRSRGEGGAPAAVVTLWGSAAPPLVSAALVVAEVGMLGALGATCLVAWMRRSGGYALLVYGVLILALVLVGVPFATWKAYGKWIAPLQGGYSVDGLVNRTTIRLLGVATVRYYIARYVGVPALFVGVSLLLDLRSSWSDTQQGLETLVLPLLCCLALLVDTVSVALTIENAKHRFALMHIQPHLKDIIVNARAHALLPGTALSGGATAAAKAQMAANALPFARRNSSHIDAGAWQITEKARVFIGVFYGVCVLSRALLIVLLVRGAGTHWSAAGLLLMEFGGQVLLAQETVGDAVTHTQEMVVTALKSILTFQPSLYLCQRERSLEQMRDTFMCYRIFAHVTYFLIIIPAYHRDLLALRLRGFLVVFAVVLLFLHAVMASGGLRSDNLSAGEGLFRCRKAKPAGPRGTAGVSVGGTASVLGGDVALSEAGNQANRSLTGRATIGGMPDNRIGGMGEKGSSYGRGPIPAAPIAAGNGSDGQAPLRGHQVKAHYDPEDEYPFDQPQQIIVRPQGVGCGENDNEDAEADLSSPILPGTRRGPKVVAPSPQDAARPPSQPPAPASPPQVGQRSPIRSGSHVPTRPSGAPPMVLRGRFRRAGTEDAAPPGSPKRHTYSDAPRSGGFSSTGTHSDNTSGGAAGGAAAGSPQHYAGAGSPNTEALHIRLGSGSPLSPDSDVSNNRSQHNPIGFLKHVRSRTNSASFDAERVSVSMAGDSPLRHTVSGFADGGHVSGAAAQIMPPGQKKPSRGFPGLRKSPKRSTTQPINPEDSERSETIG